MKKIFTISAIVSLTILSVGCSTIKGTVYKQNDGSYKADYAASTERKVRKVIHADAQLTCKDKDLDLAVVEENIENMEDDSKKEGFAAVAGSAVSLAGKYFGSESVRGSLVFNCK